MAFHWSLTDSKYPQVSRTLLTILAVLNNVVVYMVSTCSPASKSSSPFNNPLMTIPKAPITIDIIVTFMFHIFSNPCQGRGTYPSFHFHSVLYCDQPGQQSPEFCKFSFFLFIIILSGQQAEIRWAVCTSRSRRSLCVPFSRTYSGLCKYDIIIILPIREFFAPALADGFPIESE